MIIGLQAPAVQAMGGKLDLQLAQYRRRRPAPPRNFDDRGRRSRYYDQDEYEDDYAREPRVSKDTVVGVTAMLVPGGAFLLWMDPSLDHKWVNSGSGLFLGLITAAVGIKFYVSGDIGEALAVHGGGIAAGLWGHHIGVRRPTIPRRGSRQNSPPLQFEAKFRF
ncbi:MAG: hypothetical protein COB53_02845 [Elusimicrobia bacterium]|nr:MAG: hypothetical protein COB53_02845 [Elusimicrobiota bacterium]